MFAHMAGLHWRSQLAEMQWLLVAIVSPQHARKGSHSRRPTNEGLMALSGRLTERAAAVVAPSPLNRVQSKSKLGPQP